MRFLLFILCSLFAQLVNAQFGPPQVISGNFPGVMNDARFADIDQDGQLDMVSASPYSAAVLWYRGYGNDNFEPGRTAIGGITNPSSIDLGDLDGDGIEDIVVTGASDDLILWARNNGFGEYQVVDTLSATMDQPAWVRIADLDGDGDPDLIAASTLDNRLAWFANDGLGNFGPQQDISITAMGIKAFVLGDVDADGDLDIVAGLPGAQTLVWYSNNGAGQFGSANILATGLAQLNTVELSDLNGDGYMDVLFTYSSDDLVWLPGTGGGNFGTITPIALVNAMTGAWAADLDNDGDQDIVVGHSNFGRVYLNDGSGTFTQLTLGFNWEADVAILQDLDGDGLIDFGARVVSTQSVDFRINLGNATFGPKVSIPATLGALSMEAADLDGDGDMDLMVRGSASGPVQVVLQQLPGVFTVTEKLQIGAVDIDNFLLQDIDQDGLMDVVFRHSDLALLVRDLYWKRNLGGTFGPEVLLNSMYLEVGVPINLADVDGDGDLDHLLTSPSLGWRRNDGSSFSAHIPIDANVTSGPAHMADLDGDGLKDIIAVGVNTVFKWYRNMGSNMFVAQPTQIGPGNGYQIHTSDLDNDGDIDVIVNSISNSIAVVMNNGDGTFATQQGYSTNNFTSIVHVFDVDGDGDIDIVNGNYTQFRWLPNNGLGLFGDPQPLQPDEPYGRDLTTSILADMDGDGLQDLVYDVLNENQLEWLPNWTNTYYRIQGRIYWDLDEDGVRDPQDPPALWIGAVAQPAPNFPFSGNNGAYLAYVDSGTFTIRPVIDTVLWRITSDSLQYTVTLNGQNPVSAGNDFGLYINQAQSIVGLGLGTPLGLCDDVVQHWITVSNLGNFVENGILALEYDTLFTLISAEPPPDSVVANTYYWSYSDLDFYTNRTIQLNTQRPGVAYIGDSIHFALHAFMFDPFVPGIIADTTTTTWNAVVSCSYDPNDKQVDPVGYGDFGAVGMETDHLDYTIRFQNTGNAPAITVTLRDTLPPQVDLSRIILLAYSFAPTDMRVDSGNVLSFRLQNIMLPDSASDPEGSQGFVRFRLGLSTGLPHGTSISNTAGIYFDNNPPVITNTTSNTLIDCALWLPAISAFGFNELTVTEGDRYQWSLDGVPISGGDQQTVQVETNGTYIVQVTSEFGCAAIAEFQMVNIGINEQGVSAFGIVPNPTHGDAVLWSIELLTPNHRVELIDAQGRSVRRLYGNGTTRLELNRVDLTPGMYAVLITTPQGAGSLLRLVVE